MKKVLCLLAVPFALASCHQSYEKTEAPTALSQSTYQADTLAPPVAADPGDTYAKIEENPFRAVAREPLSTFALDVDRASYANVRRFLQEGQLPPRDAVRVEELLNYFSYDLPAPAASSPDPVRISTELSDCPWAPGHQLARIGIQAKKIEATSLPPLTWCSW